MSSSRRLVCFAQSILLLTVSSQSGQPPIPPVAPRIAHSEVRFGNRVEDDYYWLRDKSNPQVVATELSLVKCVQLYRLFFSNP
jgi:hypothetical protein